MRTKKYEYVAGYLSDLVKDGNHIEVKRVDKRNLLISGYDKGKLLIENKILLDDKGEIVFADHTKYMSRAYRTIVSYSRKTVDKSTVINIQQCYDITDGTKKLNHRFETTEISSFDPKTRIKTIFCKTKAVLVTGQQPETETKIFMSFNTDGKIQKVEYPDKYIMNVNYN